MSALPQLADRLALDVQGATALRAKARAGDPEALRAAAKQFEALVVQTLIRNMRETRFSTPDDPLAESAGGGLYRELLDQQWAQRMVAGRGFGFAEAMVKAMEARQGNVSAEEMARLAQPEAPGGSEGMPLATAAPLPGVAGGLPSQAVPPSRLPSQLPSRTAAGEATSRVVGLVPAATAQPGPGAESAPPSAGRALASEPAGPTDPQRRFLEQLRPHAEKVAAEIGLAADFILAHAALESGWGRRAIRTDSGEDSYNLFGIKAGRGWKGGAVEQMTTEYQYGVALRKVEPFRAYTSYEAAFRDYAELLKARYPEAVGAGAALDRFAAALADGGYATDPAYAEKLKRVAASVARRSIQV